MTAHLALHGPSMIALGVQEAGHAEGYDVALVGRLVGIRLVPLVSPLAFRRATLGLLLLTGGVSVLTGLAALA